MGDYIISDNVINSIAIHEAQKINGLIKVQNINLRKTQKPKKTKPKDWEITKYKKIN